MFGGGKSMTGLKFKSIGGGGFLVLLTAVVLRFILIAIQSALVQLAYNNIWPKLAVNSGGDVSKFTPLTYFESFMVVVLFTFLFV